MTTSSRKSPLILSVATQSTAQAWRVPNDQSREFTRDLNALIELAKTAERGKLHNIFFVDHLSWFDVYGNSHEASARLGANASRIDPTIAISALASYTNSIGFVITVSTISEHPYHLARRLATVDHLTNGRSGWNIVSSYLPSSGRNLLNGAELPEHDERYVKTTEYLDTIYELLASSWRDDALVYDKKRGIFADPDAIREINHVGKYFNVKGPAITEPTKQRVSLLAQAGGSKKGIQFSAENAELVYITLGTSVKIPEIRKIAQEKFNRSPDSIKFITQLSVFLGDTHEEAVEKFEIFKSNSSLEGSLVIFGGVSGFDLSGYDWDEAVDALGETNGIQSYTDNVLKGNKTVLTKKDIAQKWDSGLKVVGTASEVADKLEEVLSKYDIDGFNFRLNSFPENLDNIVDLLIPELQSRGLAQTEYTVPGGTLRENFYSKPGQQFVPGDHPAYGLRWREGVTKEQFEKELGLYEQIRDERRAA